MVRTGAVEGRLTRTQQEQVRRHAARRGFTSLASCLRYVALDNEFVVHQKINEIHRAVLGDEPAPQRDKSTRGRARGRRG